MTNINFYKCENCLYLTKYENQEHTIQKDIWDFINNKKKTMVIKNSNNKYLFTVNSIMYICNRNNLFLTKISHLNGYYEFEITKESNHTNVAYNLMYEEMVLLCT